MSTPGHDMPELSGDDLLAAEYAMGLLEGEDLLAVRGRMAREPAFAGLVAQWEPRLAPLLDEPARAAPSPEVWSRIAGELEERDEAPSPVVLLQRRVAVWQRIAAGDIGALTGPANCRRSLFSSSSSHRATLLPSHVRLMKPLFKKPIDFRPVSNAFSASLGCAGLFISSACPR